MASIYFQTTHDCNLSCEHCFQDAGPHRKDETISPSDFDKSIHNMPPSQISLDLTGGELFKNEKLLWEYLDIIKVHDKKRKNPFEVNIQTNALWVREGKEKIKQIFEKLEYYKIKELDVTSNDEYHEKVGMKKEYIDALRLAQFEFEPDFSIDIRGAQGKNKIFPTGRGKNIVDKNTMDYGPYSCGGWLDRLHVSITPNGEVYYCCFNQFPLGGNIINEKLEKIVKRAKRNLDLHNLNKDGIKGLALGRGENLKFVEKQIKEHGNCGYCANLQGLFF